MRMQSWQATSNLRAYDVSGMHDVDSIFHSGCLASANAINYI